MFEKNSSLLDRLNKTRRLHVRLRVTGNATPADKTQLTDLPDIAILRTEGLTATADAVETSVGFTTADDEASGNSVFGVLLKGTELGNIERVVATSITDRGGTATSVSATRVHSGGTVRGLTADGNIAVDITGTGLRLDTENADLDLTVDYIIRSSN